MYSYGFFLCVLSTPYDHRGAVARAPGGMLALNFIGPVLIRYAIKSAGADGKVFGLVKASSVLMLSYTLFAFSNILLGPIMGTVADFTCWRRKLMVLLLLLVNLFTGLLIMTGPDTWQVAIFFLWLLLSTCDLAGVPINSYLPEISNDQQKLTVLNAKALIDYKVVALVFSGISIGLGHYLKMDDTKRITCACLVALAISVPSSLYAVCHMPFREAVAKFEGQKKHPFVAFEILTRNVFTIRASYPMVFRYLSGRCFAKVRRKEDRSWGSVEPINASCRKIDSPGHVLGTSYALCLLIV